MQLDEPPFKRGVGLHIIEIEGESPFLEVFRRTITSAVKAENRARARRKTGYGKQIVEGSHCAAIGGLFVVGIPVGTGIPPHVERAAGTPAAVGQAVRELPLALRPGHGSADVGALQPESPRRGLVFSEQIMQRGEACLLYTSRCV